MMHHRADGRGPDSGGARRSSAIQQDGRETGRPPSLRAGSMLVFAHSQGLTGPKEVDGQQTEGTFRAHQLPLAVDAPPIRAPEASSSRLRSYRPEELLRRRAARLVP
ncbi:MAG: hypothetical protein ACLRWQ_19520 [Flavonifractor plautii]